MKQTTIGFYLLLIFISLSVCSCKEYLDVKPDKKLAIPYTGDDLQAILDYISKINDLNPGLAEIASDNFFLPYENWQGIIQEENRDSYLWLKTPVHNSYWSYIYQKIYYVNTVLDYINKVTYKDEKEKQHIYGSALFVRGMAFHKLAEVFAVPYDKATAEDRLGVVLKLSSDINENVERSTLEQTYLQIKEDLSRSVNKLSASMPEYPTRASKAAAYSALARYYLSMREYRQAGVYADSCLSIKNDIVDYNTIEKNKPYPFELYNKEVVYHTRSYPFRNLSEENARVDTVLYNLYSSYDLRKEMFFTKQADGYYSFTGDYSLSSIEKFDGITTAEMLLIQAETKARAGKIEEAKQVLINLLKNRYSDNTDINDLKIPITQNELVDFVLLERQKELIGRGQRWSDIRRLSFDTELTLTRVLNNKTFQMKSENIRDFAFLLPSVVIERSSIKQNF